MIRENCNHLNRHSRRFAVRTSVAIWLLRFRYPRLAIAAALLLASGVGFGTSYLLSRLGMSAMWLRYPIAFLASYFAFLCVLGMLATRAAHFLRADRYVSRDSRRRQFRSDDSVLPERIIGSSAAITSTSRDSGRLR